MQGGGNLYFDITPYKALGYIEFRNHYIGTDELSELLQNATLTVCPYIDATQSGVIMTSFSTLTPVVATNVGGLGEMIADGQTGILVPPKNADALSNAIVSLLSDRDKLNSMKANIKKRYLSGPSSWDTIADKYICFYNRLS